MDHPDQTPVVVAYDGSPVAQAGVRRAAELFAGRRVIVATIWEPGLGIGMLNSTGYESMGAGPIPPDPKTVQAIDTAQKDMATSVAEAGAGMARDLGLAAEPLAVPDEADVAETLLRIAADSGASAVVIGSHGVSGLRSHLVGSVTRRVLRHSELPVVVIRG